MEKMKIYLQPILIVIIFYFFSCKQDTAQQKRGTIKQSIVPTKDSITEKELKKSKAPKIFDPKYVIARSGLNYRDSPKGKVLGKFPLNTSLNIIERTKIYDQVKEDGKIIKGEWIGALRYLTNSKFDTVYVFNGFLSHSYIQSDIKLYYASSYYKENNGSTRTAFLNLSETYFEDAYNESDNRSRSSIFTESDLEKDTIRLNKSQRDKFLKYSNISESDKVFVYLISSDKIQTYNVKDLSVIACMSPYGPMSFS